MQYYFLQLHKLMAVHICMCYDMGMCVCEREHCQQMCNYVSLLPNIACAFHHSSTIPECSGPDLHSLMI